MFPKRKIDIFLAVFTAVLISLFLTSLAQAGGWAVITLDRQPENVTAGQPYALGFMVRQHGRTPWQVEQIEVHARQAESSEPLTFIALPAGDPGHYQVELLFPKPGAWEWSIQSGLYPQEQPMPALQVTEAAAPAAAGAKAAPGERTALSSSLLPAGIPGSLVGILALLALAGGAVLLARGPAKRLNTIAGAGLLIACGALAFAFFTSLNGSARPAAPANPSAGQSIPVSAAAAATGKELFLEKGCVVCHVNTRALQDAEQYSVNFGPNLSAYHNDPEYLRKFLADPGAVKPGTEMPTLGLSTAEITALIDFLNSKP